MGKLGGVGGGTHEGPGARTICSLRSAQVSGYTPFGAHSQDCAASLACECAGLTCNFASRYVILRLSLHLSLAR